jgi:hypothetical protein
MKLLCRLFERQRNCCISNINIYQIMKTQKIFLEKLFIFINMGKTDLKGIKKYCEHCGDELILKINRDIIRKRFCSHKCSSTHTTTKRQIANTELLKRFILAGQTEDVNKRKGLKKESNPRWKGGDQTHICQMCKSPFTIPIYRSN